MSFHARLPHTGTGGTTHHYGGDGGGPVANAKRFQPSKDVLVDSLSTNFIISTIAGTGVVGSTGDSSAATSALLNNPSRVAVDTSGNMYINDDFNNKIRKVSSTGIITTFAGTGTRGSTGDGGAATSALLYNVYGSVCVDLSGKVYIGDNGNNKIRVVDSSGIITAFAGTGVAGYSGDGGAATSAKMDASYDFSVDVSGNVYIAEIINRIVRKVNSAGIISLFAGQVGLTGYSGDGGQATSALLNGPYSVSADISGNVYIAEYSNHIIRKVNSAGIISLLAGTVLSYGFSGDGGQATSAQLYGPYGVFADMYGNVFIADKINNRIRMVNSAGIIATIAGTGVTGSSGDGGAATSAQLNRPQGVYVDSSVTVYIADTSNNEIRVFTTNFKPVPTALPTGQPSRQPSRQPSGGFNHLKYTLFYLSFFLLLLPSLFVP